MSAPIALLADARASLGGVEAALIDGRADDAKLAHAAASRSLSALGTLLGVSPAPVPVSFVPAEERAALFGKSGGCPRCGSKKKEPSAGFGATVTDLCGECGHDLSQ